MTILKSIQQMLSPPEAPPLSSLEGRSLYRIDKGTLQLEVHESRKWRWLSLGDRPDIVQALFNRKYPHHPMMSYCIGMLTALLLQPQARQALNLGLGCGAFERYLLRHYSQTALTSVEMQGAVVDVARRFFDLPSDYPVVIDDAASYLKYCHQSYDLILCDLHDGNRQPAVNDKQFLSNLCQRLSDTGVVSMNLFGAKDSYELVALLQWVRQQLPHTVLLKPPRSQNMVLLASRQPLPDMPELRRRADALQQHSGLALHDYLDCWQTLPFPP